MSNTTKPRKLKKSVVRIFLLFLIILLIAFFLRDCSGCGKTNNQALNVPSPIIENEEQRILQIMKRDEQYLKDLYTAPNICEKEWIKEYRSLGVTFQTYTYKGTNEEIKQLLVDYVSYGKKIEEIAIHIDENNYEKGIEELEELKAEAGQNEMELKRLYDKEFSKNKG